MTGGTALVTGASAGIGRELARQFAAAGHDVVLVARREEKLRETATAFEEVYDGRAEYVVQDLASREGREALYDATADRGIAVEYLVNNVGIGTQGQFVETDLERELDQVELNVATPVHLTKLYGPEILEAEGGVLNVASTAAFQPGPYMAGYYASKAYVLSFSQGLHEEFAADGATVTALCPGPVPTEFQERAGNTHTGLGGEGQGFVRWQDVETVAAAGYRGLMDGRAVVTPGIDYKLLDRLSRVTPRPIARKLAARLNR